MKQKDLKVKAGLKPNEIGYRMPAEWERHRATWLAWPHDLETWPEELGEVEDTYVEIIEQLHGGEEIHILVENHQAQESVSKKLSSFGLTKNIFLHLVPTNSIWIRDYGPIFLTGKVGETVLTDWLFNAWGRKYDSFEKDNGVPAALAKLLQMKSYKTNFILEGGSIDVNGSGACLATEECLLNANRNKGLSRGEIEECLKDFLGVRHLIWLSGGVVGDDTDGHVDEVARFVNAQTVLVCTEENTQDQNFSALQKNKARLSEAVEQDGHSLNVVSIPMPEKLEAKGMIFPASYANFYIANRCVLVPIFGGRNDTKALGILKDLFPGRSVIGIPAVPLIYGQGAMHCITQQEPAP